MDGKEIESEFWNSPRITVVNWSDDGKKMTVKSDIEFNRDGQISEMTIEETYYLGEDGKILFIKHHSSSEWGERFVTMAFDKTAE